MRNQTHKTKGFNLRVSQRYGVDRVKQDKHVGLFCGLGFGKTLTGLTAFQELQDENKVKRALVIGPLKVAQTVWHAEGGNWNHLDHLHIERCVGTPKARISALMSDSDVMVINRENVVWLYDYLENNKIKWPFDMVIIDESSSFKSHSSKRFKTLKKVWKKSRPNYTVLLSGTPAPNGEMDLWAQHFLIDEGAALGKNITAFRSRYFTQNPYNFQYDILPHGPEAIKNKVKPTCVYIETRDVVDMPPVSTTRKVVEIPAKIKKMIQSFKTDLVLELDSGVIDAPQAAVLSGRILQMMNGAIYTVDDMGVSTGEFEILHDEKIKALKELVEDNPDENMLVAYNFKHDLKRLQKEFPHAKIISEKNIELWNRGKIKMLLAHPASAGHGLNLQFGGNVLVWFGLNWSLELYDQFNGRLDRPGQENPVQIIHIVSDHPDEVKVSNSLEDKTFKQNDILGFIQWKS